MNEIRPMYSSCKNTVYGISYIRVKVFMRKCFPFSQSRPTSSFGSVKPFDQQSKPPPPPPAQKIYKKERIFCPT